MDAAVTGWEDLNGLNIEQIGRKWNTSSFNALLKLCEESGGTALVLIHSYSGEPGNESPLESALTHEACVFETDAVVHSTGYPNPAAMGTFPKILGSFVREKGLLRLEDAINRMTLASADRFGLEGRGALLPGKAADLVVFDPKTIADTPPTGAQPAGRPKGIVHVFTNGTHVVKDGSYTPGARAGRVLR
jgi:N-acyl-D-aspartate/D-glutamate deacylase